MVWKIHDRFVENLDETNLVLKEDKAVDYRFNQIQPRTKFIQIMHHHLWECAICPNIAIII
jgi:hypothetical protein